MGLGFAKILGRHEDFVCLSILLSVSLPINQFLKTSDKLPPWKPSKSLLEVALIYKMNNFNVVDTVVVYITVIFNQSRFKGWLSIGILLVCTTNVRDCQDSRQTVRMNSSQDVGETDSIAQLETLKAHFQDEQETSIIDVISKMRKFSKLSLVYFSQVVVLMRMFIPVTATVIEGSASGLCCSCSRSCSEHLWHIHILNEPKEVFFDRRDQRAFVLGKKMLFKWMISWKWLE